VDTAPRQETRLLRLVRHRWAATTRHLPRQMGRLRRLHRTAPAYLRRREAALHGVDAQSQMPIMRLETLLLRAIDSYESRHGTDPTVVELAADLGIPSDFGHSQLVERLRHEVSAGFVSHYRGRISLTAADAKWSKATPPPPSRPDSPPCAASTPHAKRHSTRREQHPQTPVIFAGWLRVDTGRRQ
jgi:hypothetical protein